MILTLSEIAADVAALTGTSVSRSDRRLRLLLAQAIAEVIMAAPLQSLSGALSLEGEIYASGVRDDVGLVPLPPDFLRLRAFRLKGWPGDVTRLTDPGDEAAFSLRLSPWPEISGSAASPRCYRVPFPGGEALEFHSAPGDASEAVVESAFYIPRPAIREETVRIPPALVADTITLTAKKMNLWKQPSSPAT